MKAVMRAAFLAGAVWVLAACSEAPVAPAIDIEQETRALLEQDQRFAELAERQGLAEAYRQVMAADALHLPDGGLPIDGADAIYAELAELTDGVDFTLTWEPAEALVAASGELGFTAGVYFLEAVDEMGAPFIAEGKYVYVWRKNQGRWELILDITNESDAMFMVDEGIEQGATIDDLFDPQEDSLAAP